MPTPEPMTPSPAVRDAGSKKPSVESLQKRIKELERHVLCVECGHLCGDHFDADGPCYGGRTPTMKPDEGEFCACGGFVSEVDNA